MLFISKQTVKNMITKEILCKSLAVLLFLPIGKCFHFLIHIITPLFAELIFKVSFAFFVKLLSCKEPKLSNWNKMSMNFFFGAALSECVFMFFVIFSS